MWPTGAVWTLDAWVTLPLAVSGLLYARGRWRLWRRVGIGRGVRVRQAGASRRGGSCSSPRSSRRCTGSASASSQRIWSSTRSSWRWRPRCSSSRRPIGGMLWALPPRWRGAVGGVGVAGRPPVSGAGSPIRSPRRSCTALRCGLGTRPACSRPLWLIRCCTGCSISASSSRAPVLVGADPGPRAGARLWGGGVLPLRHGAPFGLPRHSSRSGAPAGLSGPDIRGGRLGLTPLEDQQLAGLIMWVPAGLVYLVAALALAGLWIRLAAPTARRGGDHALVSP